MRIQLSRLNTLLLIHSGRDGIPNRKRFGALNRTPLPAFPETIRDYISNAYAEEEQVWLELDHIRFFEMMARRISG